MSAATIHIFVPDVPEFRSLVDAAERNPDCHVTTPLTDYHLIASVEPLEFRRKELGLKPAVWYGLFTGGLRGRVELYDRDRVRIVPVE